ATDTPSLVMVGAPKLFSSTTLRPFGPSVALTAFASTFTPRTMRTRASSEKRISLAAMVKTPQSILMRNAHSIDRVGIGSDDHCHQVFFAHDEKFLTVHLDLGAGVLAEQHLVAGFDRQRTDLAVFENLAGADGDDFALDRLLGGGRG